MLLCYAQTRKTVTTLDADKRGAYKAKLDSVGVVSTPSAQVSRSSSLTHTRPPVIRAGFFSCRNPRGKAVAMFENNQTKSNGRGGARKGAGRKTGSASTKTREVADKAAEVGMTPLEYMLEVMRRSSDHGDPRVQVAREAMRFEAAKAAAPYIHPRLSSVEVEGNIRVSLAAELAALNAAH